MGNKSSLWRMYKIHVIQDPLVLNGHLLDAAGMHCVQFYAQAVSLLAQTCLVKGQRRGPEGIEAGLPDQ